jgi:signal peptidase II
MEVDMVHKSWLHKAWPVLAIAGIVILLDRWTKDLVRQSIPQGTYTVPIPALREVFVFEHVVNDGAAFGILQNQRTLLIAIAVVVAVATLVYVRSLPMDQKLMRVLLGLQLGGAMGNAIDRFTQGYVTDFIKMGVPNVYYVPNYNVADAAIFVGIIGLAVYILWDDRRQQRRQKQAESVTTTST